MITLSQISPVGSLQAGSCVILTCLYHSLSALLLFGITRCSNSFPAPILNSSTSPWRMGYIETKILAICFKTLLEDSAAKCLYIHINKCVHIHLHTKNTYTYIYVHLYPFIYIYIYTHTSAYVCACVCIEPMNSHLYLQCNPVL